LLNPDFIDPGPFADLGFDWVETAASEPLAANAVWTGDSVLFPQAFAETAQRLQERGFDLRRVAADELAKAEGGLTCCSLIFGASA
jgi:dimethylargininase